MDDEVGIDIALAAWSEGGRWSLAPLPPRATESMDVLVGTLRQLVADRGAVGVLLAVEDFFLAVRVMPEGSVRLLLSDVAAALDWPIAEAAAEMIGADIPDDELDEIEPVGDVGLLSDMGVPITEMEIILDDPDLYPDEQVATIAARLGFGDQFAEVLDSLDR